MELHEILSHFPNVKKASGNRYECCCPCHDDTHPSLIIYVNDEWVNVKCYAGCETENVLRAVGLEKSDLKIGGNMNKPKVVNEITYEYCRADGALSYKKVRQEYEDGRKSFLFQLPDGSYGLKGTPHLLYNMQNLADAETIFFTEGEKCADAVIKQGCVATTLDSGANSKWNASYKKVLTGKTVVILPDNDSPGMAYAEMIKSKIPWAVIKKLPGLKEKEDVYDWLQAGHSMDEIDLEMDSADEQIMVDDSDYTNDKRQQSVVLLNLIAGQNVGLFLNENNEAYAEFVVNGHKEIHSVEGRDFALWAQRIFHQKTMRVLCREGLAQTVEVLTAETKFNNKERHTLANRVARAEDAFVYDLTNENWSLVRITPKGWSVVENQSKLFCRYRHQVPQQTPQRGGDLTRIFQFINMPKFQILFLCWLVSCYVPDIPHPMPIIYGEKGAAKSTACDLLKRLIDPSALGTLALSKDVRSLVVSLQQHYFLPFDNVSAISNETSDTLCRAITGGAIQQRKLHTNGEDYIFTFRRCLALNGIHNVANRSDLLDRSILFELERVSEDKRMELQAVYDAFEAERPFLLGAVFDTLAGAMQIYPNVKLERLPRMADFCRWGYAIAEALGGHGERFLQEYKYNQVIQNTEAINSDAVAFLIVEFMRRRSKWRGRVSELFRLLKDEAEKNGINPSNKNLPQAPNNLSRRIKAVQSNLECAGITFEFDTGRSDGTYIVLMNEFSSPLPPYHVDTALILNGDGGGDGDGETQNLSPSHKLPISNNNGDGGDDGDDSESIEF